MSKDIRSFFQKIKTQKSKTDDEDVIPESPDVQIKNKKKESRKKRVLSDSEEEIFTPKKSKTSDTSNKISKGKTKKSPPKQNLKAVNAVDIFGSTPIKRSEPLVKTNKKKTEIGIHSDDEFDKSLLELDEVIELAPEALKTEKSIKTNCEQKEIAKSNGNHVEPMNDSKKKTTNSERKTRNDNHKPVELIENHKNNENTHCETVTEDYLKKKNHDNCKINKTESNGHSSTKKYIKEDIKCDTKSAKEHHDKKEKSHSSSEDISNKIQNSSNMSKKDTRKREFAEFTEGDTTGTEEHEESKMTHKKKKLNKSLNESVLTDEERHEKRMYSAQLYQKYLNRSGPKHLGAKQIPEGSPNCLKNCAFLLTGVLDSFEREEVVEAINRLGGSIKHGISKKVTHVLAGEDAGPAKMAKAHELGIKILNEDEFLQLISDLSNNKSSNKVDIKTEVKKEKSPNRKTSKEKLKTPKKEERNEKNNVKISPNKNGPKDLKIEASTNDNDKKTRKHNVKEKMTASKDECDNIQIKEKKMKPITEIKEEDEGKVNKMSKETNDLNKDADAIHTQMWVEKYKPQNVKQIIGQHGDASNVKKLTNWLTKWYVNRKAKLPRPSPWAKNDDGGFYKAALLSGPPGVGKTTTVSLVCKELGFDLVEFNASDTRNKTLIREQIGELLTTTSLSAYAKGDTGKQAVTKKHVLVMDEVDGMAGNEDRGGLQELIGLIKSTSVPIICICNDRNSQKMRSLVNYCYDLRFNRPRVDQIKSAMMSICFKEGIKIPPDALSQLIVAANQDVRQTLNLLSMWAINPDLMDAESLKRDAGTVKKDIKLGPWEALRKVFSAEDHKTMSINDKSDLFFYDYSLAPLFVQENYLSVTPHCPKHEVLGRVSMAADCISAGDLIDARIRRNQAWNLLPVQAMYSSVMPGHAMSGHVNGQIQFPGWLGKNSRANKMNRLCQEIHAHTRLSTSGSKSSIFLDYCTHLRDAIVTPLIKDKADGIAKAMDVLESYHLLREDLDSLSELSVWPGQRDPMVLIDSKVKAAMTRAYNKKATALPYAPAAVKRGRGRDGADLDADGADLEEGDGADVDPDADADADSDPENDALIKKKKTKDNEKPSSSKDKPGTSKEKSSSGKDKPGNSKRKK